MSDKHVEYVCTYCGKHVIKGKNAGRPEPGKGPRKKGDKPHSWRVNKHI